MLCGLKNNLPYPIAQPIGHDLDDRCQLLHSLVIEKQYTQEDIWVGDNLKEKLMREFSRVQAEHQEYEKSRIH